MKTIDLQKTETGYRLIVDGMAFNLLSISGGSFQREDGQTVKVNSFCMAQFQVTQELYEAVTGDNPSRFKGSQHPTEQVSWYDSVKFCGILNQELTRLGLVKGKDLLKLNILAAKDLDKFKLDPAASGFRLPTEAEWEYAARGNNNQNQYAGSNHLDLVGWYEKNNEYETKPVGLKFPNAFGLHDMSGNVWEWCWDWYADYDKKNPVNPVGANSGAGRVDRGGSWFDFAFFCRPDFRYYFAPDYRYSNLGFRLAFVP